MTVSSQVNRKDYSGNGSTTNFATEFRFLEDSHLRVILTVDSTGVETVQSLTTNYTVTGKGEDSGGTVTMIIAPATGETLTIIRDVPVTQQTDYVENDDFPAESHERALDKLTMIVQQQQEEISRSVKVTEGNVGSGLTIPAPEDGKLLRGNDTGGFDNVTILQLGAVVDAGDLPYNQGGTGSVNTTVETKLQERVSVEDFGAVGDGSTDDAAAFLLSQALNIPIELQPGKVYAIGSQITATANGQGFYCRDGWAEVLILTGAGKFDRSDYSGSKFDADAMPFLCLSFDEYIFKNIRLRLETGNGVRTVGAISVRDTDNSRVDVEVTGFTEPQNGVTNFDSNTNGQFRVYGHDIGTSDDTLPSMQITVLDIDNDRVGGVPTTNTRADAYGENILLTGAALTKYDQQTDGMNISGSGAVNTGLLVSSRFTSVGEVLDCFGSHVVGTAQGEDVKNYCLKLIHGARFNKFTVLAGSTGGPAVTIAGSNTATQTVAYNHVTLVCSDVGSVSGFNPLGGSKCAVTFDGSSATFKPEKNYVFVTAKDSGDMLHVVDFQAGSNNIVEYNSEPTQGAQVVIGSLAGDGNKATDLLKENGGFAAGRYLNGSIMDLDDPVNITIVADTLYALPFILDGTLTVTSMSIRIGVAGVGNARLGIYEWTTEGVPGRLIIDAGTVPINNPGIESKSINLTIPAGKYILALVSDGTPEIRSTDNRTLAMSAFVGSAQFGGGAGGGLSAMTAAFTFGTLPAVFPAISYSDQRIPSIPLRTS